MSAGLSYLWSVTKDGIPVTVGDNTSQTFQFTPADLGEYNVTLTVSHPIRGSAQASVSVEAIPNVTLTLSGAAEVPTNGLYALTLEDLAGLPPESVTGYTVRWGDGSSGTWTAAELAECEGRVTHVYGSEPIARTIAVDVTDVSTTYSDVATKEIAVVLPWVEIAATNPCAGEVDLEPGEFTVYRSGPTTTDLVVSYAVGGTATAGTDYVTLAGSVTIPAGSSSAVIAVTPYNDDGGAAGDETVVATLASGAGYQIAGSQSEATVIIGQYYVPQVSVRAGVPSASEAELEPGEFVVTRSGPTDDPLTVCYTVGGTAVADVDYEELGGSVTIPAGSSDAVITVMPLDAGVIGGSVTVSVTLDTDSGYRIDGGASASEVTIYQDLLPLVTVEATDASAAEVGYDLGEFTVTRNGPLDEPLMVLFSLGGTALNGTDYETIEEWIPGAASRRHAQRT